MSIKLWGFPASAPTRALVYLLKKLGLEYEFINVNIPKETRSEDYKKNINPRGQVPVLEYDGTKLYESCSIARFLIDLYDKDAVFIPQGTTKIERARIEAGMDLYNTSLRPPFLVPIYKIVVEPKFLGEKVPSEEDQKKMFEDVHKDLGEIESILSDNEYLIGDYFTFGDILLYTQITSYIAFMKMGKVDKVAYELDEKYPKLWTWMNKLSNDSNIQEVDTMLNEALGIDS